MYIFFLELIKFYLKIFCVVFKCISHTPTPSANIFVYFLFHILQFYLQIHCIVFNCISVFLQKSIFHTPPQSAFFFISHTPNCIYKCTVFFKIVFHTLQLCKYTLFFNFKYSKIYLQYSVIFFKNISHTPTPSANMMCIVLCFSCNNCNNDVSLIMFFYTYSIGLVAEFTYVNERPPLFYFMTFHGVVSLIY